jgi:deoxyinosine 3'endonuclease (endonuclease V)
VVTGTHCGGGVFVGADVHYLASGGARAAAVVAADAVFSCLTGDRVAVVPEAEPYQPGRFYLRELRRCARCSAAAGMPRADAASLVRHMAGQHRLPDALRRADHLARHGLPQPPRR